MPTPRSNAQKIHPASGLRIQITTQQELPLRRLPQKWPINPHIVKMGFYGNQRNVCEVPSLPARLGGRRGDTLSLLKIEEKKRGTEIWALILNQGSAVLVHASSKTKQAYKDTSN